MFGYEVSDLQDDMDVEGGYVIGSLKYIDEGALATDWGAGNFMCLNFADNDFTGLTSVKVGMDPSQGSGLVEIINDPDKNGVFKVTNPNTQKFKIVQTDGTITRTQYLDLTNLELEEGDE